jgi:hypothetical protein
MPDIILSPDRVAYLAAIDASTDEAWLGREHTRAYNEARQQDCIRIINRLRKLRGTPVAPRPRRRAYAHHFTTW